MTNTYLTEVVLISAKYLHQQQTILLVILIQSQSPPDNLNPC